MVNVPAEKGPFAMPAASTVRPPARPILEEARTLPQQLTVVVFLLVPALALVAAVPWAWGWGLGWTDVGIAAGFYVVACLGVTVGFPRYFTHRAFRPNRVLSVVLGVAGSLAVEGSVVDWARRASTPSRLLRQGGRSALAVALRDEHRRGGQGFLARPHGLDSGS
ncbi:MAG: hypothetical protein QOG20_5174 [Pseudonocardiales bacterium]|nr:hypothetical protein [Pseudonocardiales bacterium]